MSTAEETPKATDSAAAGDDLALLLGRVAARDAAAFASLYRATHAVLYGVVARITIADVLQSNGVIHVINKVLIPG